jgi:hypothetical protein
MTVDPLRLRFVDFGSSAKTPGQRWYYFRSKETGRIRLPGEPASANSSRLMRPRSRCASAAPGRHPP